MPRKGENIYKRKDGRWEGRYIKSRKQDGKAVYGYIYAHSYLEAKQKRAIAVADVSAAPHPTVSVKTSSVVFQTVAEDWLSSVHSQIKESSYVKYRNSLYSYIIPYFTDTVWEELNVTKIHSFCNYLLSQGSCNGNGLSPKTVSDILSMLRNIFHYAQMQGLQVPCTGREIVIRQKAPDMEVFSLAEQEQLCQYLYSHLSEKNLGILLCLFTGLRIGELCALKWEDFSFSEKTIFVHQTMQRLQIKNTSFSASESTTRKTSVIVSTPKSKCSIRTIPLPENLLSIIRMHFPDRYGYVLARENGRYIEPRNMQNHFRQTLENCGLKQRNFHSLRHTFATRCVEVGFDIKSLSEILGHASVSITMNRYVHPSMELKQQNMQRLSGLFTVM